MKYFSIEQEASALRKHLRAMISARLEPSLNEAGFQRTKPSNRIFRKFERYHGGRRQLVSIEFEKYDRPLFVLNIYDEARLNLSVRLQCRATTGLLRGWYGFRHWRILWPFLIEGYGLRRIDDEVEKAWTHLPQIWTFLEQGTRGPNLRIHPRPTPLSLSNV